MQRLVDDAFLRLRGFSRRLRRRWENNGLNTGFNFGTRLGRFSDVTGIGFQMGGSIGIYDWSGTDYRFQNMEQAETQGFLTMGFFRKAQARFALGRRASFSIGC